ncbi:MAG: DUF1592 domain-containing protein [Sandaracinaceae bacterium]
MEDLVTTLTRAALVLALSGCQGVVSAPPPYEQLPPPPPAMCDLEAPLDPGVPAIRRLSNVEYTRSVRDALGPEVATDTLTSAFPPDEIAYGFDSIGASQRITAAHFERYFDAASTIATEAMRRPGEPIALTVEVEDAGAFDAYGNDILRNDAAYPGHRYFIGNGTTASERAAIAEGTYEVDIIGFVHLENLTEGADLRILEGDLQVDQVAFDSPASSTITRTVHLIHGFEPLGIQLVNRASTEQSLPRADTRSDCVECAGPDEVCAAERCYSLSACAVDAECAEGERCLSGTPNAPAGTFCSLPRTRRTLYLDRFEVRGPLEPPVPNPLRERLLVCDPDVVGREACSREILALVAPRAWRRPLEGDELDRLTALAMHPAALDFETGMRTALSAVFLSPSFLFRVEDSTQDSLRPLSQPEVATRLSYLLWGTGPDRALLDLAERGQLLDRLPAEVDRMLDDERAVGLIDGFVGQWLATRLLRRELLDRDPTLYPGYDATVQAAMAEEIERLFTHVLAEDRPLTELLSANYGFMNDRLREFYDLPGGGADFERVDLTGAHRGGGLLMSGGLLALNSHRARTSIVGRGAWVLANLLCEPPPDPPDNVEFGLPDRVDPGATLRDRMEQHRSDPACRGCHQAMDNIGFGLEEYDAVGRFRTTDEGGNVLDATGELPDGTTFDGAEELAAALSFDPRFARCVSQRLLTYGTGRAYFADTDRCALETLVERAGGEDATLRSLLHAMIESELFLTRRGESL